MGLKEDSKSLATPGVNAPKGADETALSQQDKELLRSCSMRLACLALDGPEPQLPSRKLAWYMQQPTEGFQEQFKACSQILARRETLSFYAQDLPKRVHVYVDSDNAGCLQTRNSTSCTMVLCGPHLLRSCATAQGMITFSLCGSELYAAVKGASIGLGSTYMARDLEIDLKKPIAECLDATAGIGNASRKGAGRIRHVHTWCRWSVQ